MPRTATGGTAVPARLSRTSSICSGSAHRLHERNPNRTDRHDTCDADGSVGTGVVWCVDTSATTAGSANLMHQMVSSTHAFNPPNRLLKVRHALDSSRPLVGHGLVPLVRYGPHSTTCPYLVTARRLTAQRADRPEADRPRTVTPLTPRSLTVTPLTVTDPGPLRP